MSNGSVCGEGGGGDAPGALRWRAASTAFFWWAVSAGVLLVALAIAVLPTRRLLRLLAGGASGTGNAVTAAAHCLAALAAAAAGPDRKAEVPEALALEAVYSRARRRDTLGVPAVRLRGGQRPEVVLVSLDVIHRVCSDHELFPDRGLPKDERVNPLSAHLFSLEGQRWRAVRGVMSPALTPAKLKALFPLHARSVRDLQNAIEATIGQGRHADVEMKQLMERFVTDDVGRTLFRVECGALQRPGNPFHAHCAQAFTHSLLRRLRQRLLRAWPALAVRIPHRSNTARFFQWVVEQLKEARRNKASMQPDLLDAMFEAEARSETDGGGGCPALARLLRSVEAPQMFATFRAGFEATAPSLTFALLELAHNPGVQRRLQREVDHALRLQCRVERNECQHQESESAECRLDDELSAELLDDMEYLDCVVKETLRKYPPNANLLRHVSQTCLLPGSQGSSEGSVIKVEKGTKLVVPVYAVHHDPRLFPDPERFDPDRFGRGGASSKAYMPFGIGRRHCVARRYALQQLKVGLLAVASRFDVSPCAATPALPPDFLAGRGIVLALRHDCRLRLTPREGAACSQM